MRFQNVRSAAVVAAMAGTLAASAASAQFVSSAILAGTGPKSVVPGTTGVSPGERFLATGSFMDRVYRSSNGNHWIITARTDTGVTATDEIVITGSGTAATVRAREGGSYFGGADAGRTLDSGQIDERVSINDSGDFVFTGNLSPQSSPDDEMIIRGSAAGTLSIATREGQVTPVGLTNGVTLTSPNIDNAGRVSYRSFVSSTTAHLLRQNGTIIDASLGAASPVAGRTFRVLDTEGYHVDASGNNWLTFAATNGTSTDDGLLLFNGSIAMREGVTAVAGGTVSVFNEWGMIPSGNWWARGNNGAGNNDWITRGNGAGGFTVVAQTDQPILTGSTETWDDAIFTDTFFLFASDNAGNYVVGGVTNNTDLNRDAVLVYRGAFGEFVIAREGDTVDLNGDGLLNDDAFITTFNNDDAFLTDAGQFVYEANLRNAAGADIGQALLTMTIPAPSGVAVIGLLGLASLRRRR
jgi:hypothetical protein